ncbi:sensor histidine kinase [Parvimonas micra]|uniref:sensor histidine kinase n=1 Tax=Parvimonas micra TaxID=33033 RepID=UPI0022B6A6F9|nr:HAMP domain-containing sensor histidine kinase [Parvimonas micra]MCZ7408593.1 HAMP domain-containing histidine kinase [Parvimonas micra]
MFSKSRKKIILSIMGSIIILFAVTLSVILLASFREIRQKNLDMLERYVEDYSIDNKEKNRNNKDLELEKNPNKNSDYQLSTFYSVAISNNGSVLAVDNGNKELYNNDELTQIAKSILDEKKYSGRTSNLSYVVRDKNGYTLVAFMDNTVSEAGLRTMLRYVLIVGFTSIIGMFLISLPLSKRIIKPLEENDRKQKQFISDASHELKTPVAIIGTNTELLSREIGNNEWLENIKYENERMGILIKQLLDLSHAEDVIVSMENINFSRIILGEILAFESFAFEKEKEFIIDIDEDVYLIGNQIQLKQLVSIILDNAIRHSSGKNININLKSKNNTIELNFINDSYEIPQEKLNHIFDRFYRVDEVRNSEDLHYGIGLSIAKAIIEKHGGNIEVLTKNRKFKLIIKFFIKN